MEKTKVSDKDVILHEEKTPEEREKELQRLKEESDNLKSWEEADTTNQ